MTGLSQQAVWSGDTKKAVARRHCHAREHVIIENRHQPTTLHLKTFINDRYKITLYFNRDYGEIYDLRNDPDELNNLWSDVELRAGLTEAFLRAEMLKEEPLTEGSLALPNKSAAMYLKSCNQRGMQINFDPAENRYELFDLESDPGGASNLWGSRRHRPADGRAYREVRAELVRALLFSRWGLEPLWMPRVSGA